MKLISCIAGLFILIHKCQLTQSGRPQMSGVEMDEFNLTTVEIIEKYGYPAEVHKTVTEDGYILELHRIPHGKNSTKPGFPILVPQSLHLDSSEYVLSGKRSLGFFLADEGYDVWLMNFRGNHYTRTHKKLSSHDSKFWDFSLHELGVYDLPASIDYICKYTKNPDLLFLGYSMGCTAFFIMGSERPEYQEKIRGAALLGPVAALKHSKAPVQFLFIPLISFIAGNDEMSDLIKSLREMIKPPGNVKIIILQEEISISKPHPVGASFADSAILQTFFKFACNSTIINRRICKYGIFAISAANPEGFDERTVLNLITHGSGTSTKVFHHYAQLFQTSRFQQYDYGRAKNLAIYESPLPPEYHLERITTPISIFLGQNDIFANPRNVYETFKKVHSLKKIYVVPEKSFTHIDFIVGKHVEEVLYPEIARQLKYLINKRYFATL